MMPVEMAAYLSEMRYVGTIKQGFFFLNKEMFSFYHTVINILVLTCSLVCNKRKLATPTAVEIVYMQMQVGNQIGLYYFCIILSVSCIGFLCNLF